jgi:GNAT superfamily N-acetyltransferase
VEVHPLEPGHAEGLLALLEVLGWGSDRDRAAARVARLVSHPDYHGWVAVDPTAIGFATGQLNWMVQVDEPVAELTGLAVLPEVAGTGVGTSLLAAFEAWAVAAGARRLKVTSGGHRPDAHRFYERRGYAQSGVRFHKLVDPDGPRPRT